MYFYDGMWKPTSSSFSKSNLTADQFADDTRPVLPKPVAVPFIVKPSTWPTYDETDRLLKLAIANDTQPEFSSTV